MANTIVFNVKTEDISQGTYDYVLPTLDDLKNSRLQYLKGEIAPEIVYMNAPLYKQQNAALGLYSTEETAAIKKWISSVQGAVNEIESSINACATQEELAQITFDHESILNRSTELNAS